MVRFQKYFRWFYLKNRGFKFFLVSVLFTHITLQKCPCVFIEHWSLIHDQASFHTSSLSHSEPSCLFKSFFARCIGHMITSLEYSCRWDLRYIQVRCHHKRVSLVVIKAYWSTRWKLCCKKEKHIKATKQEQISKRPVHLFIIHLTNHHWR